MASQFKFNDNYSIVVCEKVLKKLKFMHVSGEKVIVKNEKFQLK